jgi:hypothetical protein
MPTLQGLVPGKARRPVPAAITDFQGRVMHIRFQGCLRTACIAPCRPRLEAA